MSPICTNVNMYVLTNKYQHCLAQVWVHSKFQVPFPVHSEGAVEAQYSWISSECRVLLCQVLDCGVGLRAASLVCLAVHSRMGIEPSSSLYRLSHILCRNFQGLDLLVQQKNIRWTARGRT